MEANDSPVTGSRTPTSIFTTPGPSGTSAGQPLPLLEVKRLTKHFRLHADIFSKLAGEKPQVLKAVGRANDTFAGIYGSTFRTGTISVGDPVFLVRV